MAVPGSREGGTRDIIIIFLPIKPVGLFTLARARDG